MGRSWHTRKEKKIIRDYGGTPIKKYGADGVIRGLPVEVRSIRARDEHRYRLMKSTHKELMDAGGSYIFEKRGKTRKLSAKKVDKILRNKKRNWYKDRTYPHTFIYDDEVF